MAHTTLLEISYHSSLLFQNNSEISGIIIFCERTLMFLCMWVLHKGTQGQPKTGFKKIKKMISRCTFYCENGIFVQYGDLAHFKICRAKYGKGGIK